MDLACRCYSLFSLDILSASTLSLCCPHSKLPRRQKKQSQMLIVTLQNGCRGKDRQAPQRSRRRTPMQRTRAEATLPRSASCFSCCVALGCCTSLLS